MPATALAALAAGTVVAWALWCSWRHLDRVTVAGASMEPTLRHGDRLVIWRSGRVRAGDIVALDDPRDPGRTLLKRVASLQPAGVFVLGDNPQWSTDSRHFGPVGTRSLIGKAVYRYAPLARAGRLRAPGEP